MAKTTITSKLKSAGKLPTTFTREQYNRWLLELKLENSQQVNRSTAALLGISEGQVVWVGSKYGKTKATAHVTEEVHPQGVGLQHGFGHWAMGKGAKGRGTSDSILRPTHADPIAGEAIHKLCCVRIYNAMSASSTT